MAYLAINDTGFVSRPDDGTQLTAVADRVNSGATITLKGVTITVGAKNNTDNSPELNQFNESQVNFSTVENDVLKVTGVIDTSLSADRLNLYYLYRLVKTVGYKVIYYPSLSSIEKWEEQLTTLIATTANTFTTGEQTNYGVSGAYPYIPVIFTSFNVEQTGKKGIVTFELSGIMIPYS